MKRITIAISCVLAALAATADASAQVAPPKSGGGMPSGGGLVPANTVRFSVHFCAFQYEIPSKFRNTCNSEGYAQYHLTDAHPVGDPSLSDGSVCLTPDQIQNPPAYPLFFVTGPCEGQKTLNSGKG